MRTLFLFLILVVSVYADSLSLNLKEFARLVSAQHRVNIILDDSIESNKFSFFLQNNKSLILLPAFKKMLDLKNLVLTYDRKNQFYYIHEKKEFRKTLHTIKLKSLSFDDVKLILDQYKDLKYSYISNTNTVMFISNYNQYLVLKKVITENDVVPQQFQIKITVVESNLDNAKDRGVEISSYTSKQSGNFQYFIKLLTNTSSAVSTVFDGASSGFSASLRYLNSLGVSTTKSSPSMLIQSGKPIIFSAVQNVPFLTSSSSVKGASQSDTQQIDYKDVGLKIKLMPQVVNDIVYIDLDFNIESFIDKSSLTPSFSKRFLKNSFQLKKGQLLVLSGFQKVEDSKSSIGIPLLMKLPYLGQVFRYDRYIHTKKSLSIMIEVL